MATKMLGRRAAVVLAGIGAALFGFSSAAQAAVYDYSNVNIKVSGGDAIAVNLCANDARDGVINTQINACNQVATSGNMIELEDVSVWVYQSGTWWGSLYSGRHVGIEVTGGLASAMNACINDAQDGFINDQQNACNQTAAAGNIAYLSNVSLNIMN